jgi:hypothetical protein
MDFDPKSLFVKIQSFIFVMFIVPLGMLVF